MLATAGREDAAATLIDLGVPSHRSGTVADGVGASEPFALRNTAFTLKLLESRQDLHDSALLLRDAFDMLEEEFEEERFFATVRRALLASPGRLPDTQDGRFADSDAGVLMIRRSSPCGERQMDYKQSGVDIEAGNEVVRRIAALARGTFTPGVLSRSGSFGGLFRVGRDHRDPVLVASADGVGTKLRVAFMTGIHDTIGADLVNHCVNDILVQGAEPLFFLDYLATGRLDTGCRCEIVEGLAEALPRERLRASRGRDRRDARVLRRRRIRRSGLHLGVVDRDAYRWTRSSPGDVADRAAVVGLHTNGYSLARKIVFERSVSMSTTSSRSSA